MFHRVLNTPLQYSSNQFLQQVKSPNMLYLEIPFLWLMKKIFLLKFEGRKVSSLKKMLTMRTRLLYLWNFQKLEWEKYDIILTSLQCHWNEPQTLSKFIFCVYFRENKVAIRWPKFFYCSKLKYPLFFMGQIILLCFCPVKRISQNFITFFPS